MMGGGWVDSKKFTVETASKETGKKYKQTWTNNMGSKGKVRSPPLPLLHSYPNSDVLLLRRASRTTRKTRNSRA